MNKTVLPLPAPPGYYVNDSTWRRCDVPGFVCHGGSSSPFQAPCAPNITCINGIQAPQIESIQVVEFMGTEPSLSVRSTNLSKLSVPVDDSLDLGIKVTLAWPPPDRRASIDVHVPGCTSDIYFSMSDQVFEDGYSAPLSFFLQPLDTIVSYQTIFVREFGMKSTVDEFYPNMAPLGTYMPGFARGTNETLYRFWPRVFYCRLGSERGGQHNASVTYSFNGTRVTSLPFAIPFGFEQTESFEQAAFFFSFEPPVLTQLIGNGQIASFSESSSFLAPVSSVSASNLISMVCQGVGLLHDATNGTESHARRLESVFTWVRVNNVTLLPC